MNSLPSVNLLWERLSIAGVAYAEAAANQLLEDVMRFGMKDFRLGRTFPTELGAVVEYTFGDTAYSIDNAHPERAPDFNPSDHGGTQLNSENILVFLRVSEIARELVPELWLRPDDDLIGRVRAARQHLDTLNEFWWLSRWIKPYKAKPSYNMHADSNLNVDWRLTWDFGLSSISVNLDAKRRCDVLRSGGEPINPKEIFEAGIIKKGRSKFRPSQPDEINVLGITLIGEIDHEVQNHAEKWLTTRADIDAIAIFSRFPNQKTGFDLHVQRKHKQDLLNQVLIRNLHDKDNCLHSLIQRPLPCKVSQLQFLP
jgi:hypothetical protein